MSGLELQRQLATANCPTPIIFITAHGDEETRARALRAGAVAFLDKPFSDEVLLRAVAVSAAVFKRRRRLPSTDTCDHVASQMAMGIEHTLDDDHSEEIPAMLAEANRCVEHRFQRAHHGDEIIGESPALKEVLRQVEIVAPTDATVLLQGETGTGKELLARAVHQQSARQRPSLRHGELCRHSIGAAGERAVRP